MGDIIKSALEIALEKAEKIGKASLKSWNGKD